MFWCFHRQTFLFRLTRTCRRKFDRAILLGRRRDLRYQSWLSTRTVRWSQSFLGSSFSVYASTKTIKGKVLLWFKTCYFDFHVWYQRVIIFCTLKKNSTSPSSPNACQTNFGRDSWIVSLCTEASVEAKWIIFDIKIMKNNFNVTNLKLTWPNTSTAFNWEHSTLARKASNSPRIFSLAVLVTMIISKWVDAMQYPCQIQLHQDKWAMWSLIKDINKKKEKTYTFFFELLYKIA